MRRVLQVAGRRFLALGSDESGAALAVTIVMFSLLFLSFASVYAIGAATRDKIHLQNAADAAAYSAAVVQADMLSRLATINKAMSWTYVQQTRRQMDYIVYKWLEQTLREYDEDYNTARDWNLETDCYCHRSSTPYPYWSIGKDMIYPTIDLNGSFRIVQLVRASLPLFLVHLLGEGRSADIPMVSLVGLGAQIRLDSTAINLMNLAEADLSLRMKGRMRDAAEGTLVANIPDGWKKDTFWSYHHDEVMGFSYPDSYVSYLRIARNNEEDERQFCAASAEGFSDEGYPDETFDAGCRTWFVRAKGHNRPASGNEIGISRAYVRRGDSALHSAWNWYSIKCIYIPPTPWSPEFHIPIPLWGDGEVYGDDPQHSFYETAVARPNFVTRSYCGEAGTISIGVARRTDNAWCRIIGNAGGLFAAFTPAVKWSWAYSSAKAGYHRVSDSDPGSRAFDISWRGDSKDHGFERDGGKRRYWNLCVSDWDAVFMPVGKSKTLAQDGEWTFGETSFLSNWATSTWRPLGGGSAGGMATVSAPSGLSGNLNWGRLTSVMFH